jgi:hemerythrin
MKFQELLIGAIRSSEIPLRFEPGAEEAMAKSVMEMLQLWIAQHVPDEESDSEFDAGYRALAVQLLTEMEGTAELPE